ncbi:MAG: serine hydrolase [Ideonella sp.]|nr:serine hydrolase [Ideonella sp.]
MSSFDFRPLRRPCLQVALALAGALLIGVADAPAQTPPAALDPTRLMQGFPPPPEYRVHIGNWQQWPQKIWSFQHTRELFPTRRLAPSGPVWVLPEARQSLDALAVGTSEAPQTWLQMLAATHTDAALVLHRGRIVEERYFNGMAPATPHLMFSATKSMVGLMAAALIAEDRLDPQARVATLLPELADSAWGGATVRQVLDMTDGVRFTEVYTDPRSDIFAYIGAMGWAPDLKKPGTPEGILGMLGTLKGVHDEPRGTAFRYRSPATDVAAWIAARAAGQSLSDWVQQRLWGPLGMEHEGNLMLDPIGTEVSFAGMSASLRDMGRIGQMLLQKGRVQGRQLIPASVAEELAQGGDVRAFAAAGIAHRQGWSYRSQWWVHPQPPRFFAAMGAFGQRIVVLPEAEIVVVLLGSHPQPVSALIDPSQVRAFAALDALLNPKAKP